MSLPYFPMYPTDFEADTSHLTLLEDGVYNRLLRLCWMTPGYSVPNDEAWIVRRLRARTDEEIEAVRVVLDEFFRVEKGRVFSPRLTREAMLAESAHQKRVDAGRKGGVAGKPRKTKKTDASNAKAKPKQPEPEPDIEDTNVSSSKKRKTRIAEDAVISDAMERAATKRGHSSQEAEAQFQKFKNDALAKGKTFVDWDRAFVTWLDSPYFRPAIIIGGRHEERPGNSDRLQRTIAAAAAGTSRKDWG